MSVQVPRMDEILMRYSMSGQVRIMLSSVMYKSKLEMGKNQGPHDTMWGVIEGKL